jgi:hypothetical protein
MIELQMKEYANVNGGTLSIEDKIINSGGCVLIRP